MTQLPDYKTLESLKRAIIGMNMTKQEILILIDNLIFISNKLK